MNALFAFCLVMTFLCMPFDMVRKPVEREEEVWFSGRALAFGLPPFLAFGAPAWQFWRSRAHFNSRAG